MALHLELHEAFGGKADHLAQEIGVGALLQKLAQSSEGAMADGLLQELPRDLPTFLERIGFTMSLFIGSLAFEDPGTPRA